MSRLARSIIISLVLLVVFSGSVFGQTTYSYKISYQASGQGNPDDMAIWIHPTDKSKSTVIAADKHGQVYVYDIGTGGQAIQVITPPGSEPGNIDVRYNFPLGGELVDIVAHNRREGSDQIVVYKVNADRTLTRIDNNTIQTAATYGFCLYRSKSSGKLYGFTTSKSGNSQQWELFDAGGGQVDGNLVRSFNVGSQTEGCVADDEYGVVYMAEEGNALWKYNAEPNGGSTRTAVDSKSGHLTADLEGVTIYKTGNGGGYIIQSSQGASRFDVYQRQAPHAYVASFNVSGASSTDGIDVSNVAMGSVYPKGVFLAHSGSSAVRGVAWDVIAAGEGLTIDTSWDPRGGGGLTPTPTGVGIQGDIDSDGDVDIFDYNILVENFGSTSCGNVADIDNNCKVDIFDYNILVGNFGQS